MGRRDSLGYGVHSLKTGQIMFKISKLCSDCGITDNIITLGDTHRSRTP